MCSKRNLYSCSNKTQDDKIARVGTQIFSCWSANRKSANFWGLLVRKSQIRKFLWCPSPQIANPQIFFQIHIGLPLIFVLPSQGYFRLRNSMYLCLKTVPKVILKFEWEHFKLLGKNYVFAEVLSLQKIIGYANRKSANRKKNLVRKLQIANPQITISEERKSKKSEVRKFAELIWAQPTFEFSYCRRGRSKRCENEGYTFFSLLFCLYTLESWFLTTTIPIFSSKLKNLIFFILSAVCINDKIAIQRPNSFPTNACSAMFTLCIYMPPLLRRGILFVVVFRDGGWQERGRMRGTKKEMYKCWSLDAYRIL